MSRLHQAVRAIGAPMVALITLAAPSVTHGATWFVNINDTVGPFDGAGWLTAFRFLESALSVAAPGDIIRVADGTYYPSHLPGSSAAGTDRDAHFIWRWGVTIEGGWAGDGADPNLHDPDVYVTIISGNIGNPAVNTDNSRRLIVAEVNDDFFDPIGVAWDHDGKLDGLTFTSSYSDASGKLSALDVQGPAAFYPEVPAYPLVENCIFSQCQSVFTDSLGGGAAVRADTVGGSGPADHLLFRSCDFTQNTSVVPGGAVLIATYNFGALVSFVSCAFESNSSTGTGTHEGCGGAVHFDEGAISASGTSLSEFVSCRFVSNTAEQGGGAIRSKIHGQDFG